tara:strand:+ start:3946 stop:4821 length:876 start_codon:yes stop_codon:yes gene_type:complete
MEGVVPTLTILGTAQDGGVPQAGCGCSNCNAAFENPQRVRFPVSLGVIDNQGGMHLIEATRALPQQLKIWADACRFDSPIRPNSVLLTHAHLGHIEGIGQFGKEAMGCRNLTLVASESVASILQEKKLMNPFVRADFGSQNLPKFQQGGVVFDFIPVPHRDDTSDTHAILISGENKRVLFLPDHDDWEQTLKSVGYTNPNEWFQSLGATHVLLDATFWNGEELSGRDMKDVPHPTVEDSLARLQEGGIDGPEIILIHLNHTNPLNNPNSHQSRMVEDAGHSIGQRGLTIEL